MSGKSYWDKHKLRYTYQFNNVYEKGIFYKQGGLSIAVTTNKLDYNRFGLSIKKLSQFNMIQRNYLKRTIREIIRQITFKKKGFDVVIMAYAQAYKKNMAITKSNMEMLFKKAKLL